MPNFNFADLYGSEYGYATTRAKAIPDQNDQEVLNDENVAAADIKTDPISKRNMVIFLVIAVALLILFSVFGS